MLRKQVRRIVNRARREIAKRRNRALRKSSDLTFAILTMSRGDETRIEEWVRYHAGLGFTEFYVILDNPIDDTEGVLRRVCEELNLDLEIEIKEAFGHYYDGLPHEERILQIREWRAEQKRTNENKRLSNHSPLARRQSMYFPDALAKYDARAKAGKHGWVALIDVDEFIVPLKWPDIPSMASAFPDAYRLRILNFDFDTSNHDPSKPFLEQHFYRWSREGIVNNNTGEGWQNRVKTMAWWGHLSPYSSVHRLSKGPATTIHHEQARLHHFRIPKHGIFDYEVHDDSTLQIFRAGQKHKD